MYLSQIAQKYLKRQKSEYKTRAGSPEDALPPTPGSQFNFS